jgi:Tfp pilus assembly protein PilF
MNMKRRAAGLTVMLLLLSSGLAGATDVSQYITEGDAANNKFDNKRALELYEKALAENPSDYEALWRTAREYINMGDLLPKDQQLADYQKAKTYADRAVQANPQGSMGYTQAAVALGKIALFKGVFDSIELVNEVRKNCDKAIQLNPKNALAYFVLARTNQKVSERSHFLRIFIGLGWASDEKAAEMYRKAISLEPDSVMFNWYYAKFLDDTGQYAQSREILAKIPNMPVTYQEDPAYKQDAQQLLAKIKNK